jgi:hypothetical protein
MLLSALLAVSWLLRLFSIVLLVELVGLRDELHWLLLPFSWQFLAVVLVLVLVFDGLVLVFDVLLLLLLQLLCLHQKK